MLGVWFVGEIMRHLANHRDFVPFSTWEPAVLQWVDILTDKVVEFNKAEFLLAIGYEAELYRVQDGDAR